jgi:hypothetical protein
MWTIPWYSISSIRGATYSQHGYGGLLWESLLEANDLAFPSLKKLIQLKFKKIEIINSDYPLFHH